MTGPWEDYAAPSDVAAMVTAEAQRQGVPPDLALRVATQESGLHHGAVSPKGAVGVMQLMPDTAKGMGVDPSDLQQNIQGGVGYLKQQLDTFGDPRLAAAAYNAGPGAVRAHGGIPPYRETQHYVDTVAPADNTPPWMDYSGQGAPSQPTAPSAPTAVAQRLPQVAQAASAPQKPTIAQDAAAGFMSPFQTLGHDVMQRTRDLAARSQQPLPSPMEALRRTTGDLGDTGRMLADGLGLAAAPVQAAIKPAARAVAGVMPTPYQAPQLTMRNGRPALTAPQALDPQSAAEGLIGTALSGAMPEAPGLRGSIGARKPLSLEEVQGKSDAAWKAVDKSGYRFPQADAQAVAQDINDHFEAEGGADLYPKAAPLVRRISSLAENSDGLSVAQVNRLRSQIGSKLLVPGSDEADIGGVIKNKLEGLIQSASDPVLGEARDWYTRLMKMREVSDRADSASLKTPLNGGITGPTRTAMRPLVDPKSPQQIRNLTPDERGALRKLANGTAGQSVTNTLSRFFDPRSLLGSTTNMLLGALTGGHAPLVTAPAGMLSTLAANAGTKKSVQKVLDLMSLGGKVSDPVSPILALAGRPALPIWSGPGLIGGTALATLPARLSAQQVREKPRR